MNSNHIKNQKQNEFQKGSDTLKRNNSGKESSQIYNNCFRDNPTLIGNQILRPSNPVFTAKQYQFLGDKFKQKTGSQKINEFTCNSSLTNACND